MTEVKVVPLVRPRVSMLLFVEKLLCRVLTKGGSLLSKSIVICIYCTGFNNTIPQIIENNHKIEVQSIRNCIFLEDLQQKLGVESMVELT